MKRRRRGRREGEEIKGGKGEGRRGGKFRLN